MMAEFFFPWLVAGTPLIGAYVSYVYYWNDPSHLKKSCLLWSLFSLVPIAGLNMSMPEGPLPLLLLPLGATISLLGHPTHSDHRLSWLMTLIGLGLGIGVLAHHTILSNLFVLVLSALMARLLFRHHTALWPMSWWGISLFGLAGFSMLIATMASQPLSSSASLLACAVLVPLLPFHTGYVTALTRLPGNLPSFAAILLPSVGLHLMAAVLPTVPSTLSGFVSTLALISALYAAIKALAQIRVRLMVAYGSLSFFSMFWWFAASSGMATARAAVLIVSIGLATCGFLIAWQVLRTRYGDNVDPLSISGLAASMPSYAVLLSLLALAAMGLPPFGVFAGFMGLLLHSPIPSVLGLLVIISTWLAASWYIMAAVQRLLFGLRPNDLRYRDVIHHEWVALSLILVALVVIGLAPSEWFTSHTTLETVKTFSRDLTWKR